MTLAWIQRVQGLSGLPRIRARFLLFESPTLLIESEEAKKGEDSVQYVLATIRNFTNLKNIFSHCATITQQGIIRLRREDSMLISDSRATEEQLGFFALTYLRL